MKKLVLVFSSSEREIALGKFSGGSERTEVPQAIVEIFIFSEGKITISKEGRGRVIRTLVRRLLNSFYILDLNQYIYIPKLIQEG